MQGKYLKYIPYLCFIMLLAVLYIGNTHAAERKMFEIQQLQRELSIKEQRLNQVKSEISTSSTQTNIEKVTSSNEIRKSNKAPIVLKGN